MAEVFRSPDTGLVQLVLDLRRDVQTLKRMPSGLNSIGVQYLQPWTKAGTPSDGDFTTPPPIGTVVYDTSASKLWVRHAAGTWKGVTVT